MTLTTHAIVAGAVVKTIGIVNPWWGFGIGILSHYMIDAIPHWDYKPKIVEKDPVHPHSMKTNFRRDIIIRDGIMIGGDGILGFIFLFLLWQPALGTQSVALILATGIGGVLPDALQMLYAMIKKAPLTWTQKVHDFFHTTKRLAFTKPAIISQVVLAVLALFLLR